MKTISPEKTSDRVIVRRRGDFEQLLIVRIDQDFRFTGKLIDREKLADGGGKFLRMRMQQREDSVDKYASGNHTAGRPLGLESGSNWFGTSTSGRHLCSGCGRWLLMAVLALTSVKPPFRPYRAFRLPWAVAELFQARLDPDRRA